MTDTIRYLTASEAAERIGLADRTSVRKWPPPDAVIGRYRGWLPETIDRWNQERQHGGGRPPKSTQQ